jgi:hypothetical protein
MLQLLSALEWYFVVSASRTEPPEARGVAATAPGCSGLRPDSIVTPSILPYPSVWGEYVFPFWEYGS